MSSAGERRSTNRRPSCTSTARAGSGPAARWATSRASCRAAEPGSARRAQQSQRVRQALCGDLDALTQLGQAVQIGEPAIDKRIRLDAARRAVVEPEQRRRGIDRGQAGALRVKAEIGRGVADRVPGAVDRLVEKAQSE